MRPRRLQKIGNDVVDAGDFLPNVFHNRARRAGRRQIAANDLDDARNSGQRVTDFVGEAGGHLSQSREMLGARHLRAVQALNFARGSRAVAPPSD